MLAHKSVTPDCHNDIEVCPLIMKQAMNYESEMRSPIGDTSDSVAHNRSYKI